MTTCDPRYCTFGNFDFAWTLAENDRLRAAHQEIIRKYERIMQGPPEWTSFTPDDARLQFAREAWFGAAQIARKALDVEQAESNKP
jgi:hypothetical protein